MFIALNKTFITEWYEFLFTTLRKDKKGPILFEIRKLRNGIVIVQKIFR